MDLKETLQNASKLAENKRMDSRLLMVVGAVGAVIIVATLWLAFKDFRSQQAISSVDSQQRAIIEQLGRPVQALKRVMNDEQVQALAARAVNTPTAVDDIKSYLNGRISEISDVQVYGSNLTAINARDLGMNGYAVLDMLLNLQENKLPQLQLHKSLVPPKMVDAVRVLSGNDLVGFMVVSLEPSYLLSHFNPDGSSLSYIGLSQYNGRQASSMLAEMGDRSLVGEVPDRQSLPGTLFRIEFPRQQYTEALGGTGSLLTLLLMGVFLLTGSSLFIFKNRRIAQAEPEAKKRVGHEQPERPQLQKPEEKDMTTLPPVEKKQEEDVSELTEKENEPPRMRLRYDIAERRKKKETAHQPIELTAGIFRAYDIRGVIGKTLDAEIARLVGQALGTVVLTRNAGPVVVARDGRLSGPYLQEAMIEGITSTGCDVLDIGAVPTGVLYYAAHELASGSGVMITGSHNPPDYNGFKIMVSGDPIHGDELSDFHRPL
jgi:hypothetical protein